MSEPMKQAWDDVADGFAQLGRAMKERYRGDDPDKPTPAAETTAAGDALRDAFDRFVGAGRDVGQRAVDVLRDQDVNAQAKQAAVSLNDALAATVDLIGRELGGLFKRSGGDEEDEPAVVGVPPDAPEAVRASVTGVVAGLAGADQADDRPDVVIADVHEPKPDDDQC